MEAERYLKTPYSVIIVGAGVIGLTTAVVLQEAGYPVDIWTKELPQITTSANSGAIWGPFLSEIDDRVLQWSFDTRDFLAELAAVSGTGVELVDGVLAANYEQQTPEWIRQLEGSSDCDLEFLPNGYICGWTYRAPIINMPIYLEYLQSRFISAGGSLVQRRVESLDETRELADFVVVCAGIGARELTNDGSLTPSKGQLVVMTNPGIERFFGERGDGPDLTYILPQGGQVVLGGTAEPGSDSLEPDPFLLNQIVLRATKIEPRLAEAQMIGYRVGIRPIRPTVRLEAETLPSGQRVIYNYGHGGSGVSLSWACAYSVERILNRFLSEES